MAGRVAWYGCAEDVIDPYLPQQDIADFCKKKGILIEAYSPLGSTGSPLFQEDGVKEVAKKHNVGPGTVLLSYQGTPIRRTPPWQSVLKLTTRSKQRTRRFGEVCHSVPNRGEHDNHQTGLVGHPGA